MRLLIIFASISISFISLIHAPTAHAGPATAIALEESSRKSNQDIKVDPKSVRANPDSEVAKMATRLDEERQKKSNKK